MPQRVRDAPVGQLAQPLARKGRPRHGPAESLDTVAIAAGQMHAGVQRKAVGDGAVPAAALHEGTARRGTETRDALAAVRAERQPALDRRRLRGCQLRAALYHGHGATRDRDAGLDLGLDPAPGGCLAPGRALTAAPRRKHPVEHQGMRDVVLDRGYHSNDVLADLSELGFRTYASEPARGRRNWKGNERARDAVQANRRRIKGVRGEELRKKRGEIAERSNAHCYETGGLRSVHVRGQENASKRILIQAATYNIALLMRR